MSLSVYTISYIVLKVKLCFIFTEKSNHGYYLCKQTHVLQIEFLAQTQLAHIHQTNQSTLEIYGS